MYEIPAHHLAAPRPAPIAFPVCAGVHAPDFAEAEAPVKSLVQAQEAPQKDEGRPTLEALLTRFEGFPDVSGKA